MKRVFVIVLFLATLACQSDDQVAPESRNLNKSTSSSDTNRAKKGSASNGRVGGHPYWYFYRSQSTTHLRSAYSDDGLTWSGDQMFTNNIGSTTSPAAVIFNNKFYCIYKGGGSNNIYFSSSADGINWQPNTQIPNITTPYAPTAVVVNGYIFVFYVTVTSRLIYYVSSPDGITWSNPRAHHSYPETCDGALNAFINPEYNTIYLYYSQGGELLYKSSNSPVSGVALFGGPYWENDRSGNIIKTTVGVGVVFKNGYRYIAYKSPSNGRLNIFVRHKDDPHGGVVYWTGAYTSNNPSMTYFDNKFTIVYKSLSSDAILRGTSVDGMVWSSNHGAIGQTTNGGPRMVVE